MFEIQNGFSHSRGLKLYWDTLRQLGRKIKIFAAKGPVYHYTYGYWRLRRRLKLKWVETAGLDEQALLTQFNLEIAELHQIKQALSEGNVDQAKAEVLGHFQTRNSPRFFFEPEQIKQITALVNEAQKEATLRTADQICQNIFCFRRTSPVHFDQGIDWSHRPAGNIDWMWDLNRHAYFETLGRAYHYTGDERYAQKIRQLWLHWLANNPGRVGQPNWASAFEVGFRINTWIWAFYYLRLTTAFDADTCLAVLKGLLTHGHYLEANLELHVQNNHLLLEAKALAMLGLLFPEFKAAEKWRQRGLKVLYQQIRAQVCPDGVHGERATHYHRVIAGELLELLVLLENNGSPIPPDINEILGKMVEFEIWVTKPDGLIPLLSDSALEDTYLRFSAARGGPTFLDRSELKAVAPALDEASIWLLGSQRVKPYLDSPAQVFDLNSRAFPNGGYFVMHQGQGAAAAYLVFDCGPFGYKPVPSHGHADALSFELHAHGQTWIVDPGIYSTHLGDDWRNFFRGSRAHNTVVVDRQDQSVLMDIWRVYRPAQASLHHWFASDHFDFVDGSHDGYERLQEPVSHRRQIFFAKPEYWVIVDSLTGQGQHCFETYFHLMPGLETQLERESGTLQVSNGSGSGLMIAPLAPHAWQPEVIIGATAPIQGWVSFFSGEKQPAPTLRYHQEAVAPLQFCTVLYPYQGSKQQVQLSIAPLMVEVQGRSSAKSELTGLRLETATHVDYLVIDRGGAGARKTFGAFETDAQLSYIRCQKEDQQPVKVVVRGGSQLLFEGRSLLEASQNKGLIVDAGS